MFCLLGALPFAGGANGLIPVQSKVSPPVSAQPAVLMPGVILRTTTRKHRELLAPRMGGRVLQPE